MRLASLFSTTLREMPAGVSHEGLRLLVRAGYARLLENGGRAYLPLGQRALAKLARVLEEALHALNAQPVAIAEPRAIALLGRSVLRSYRQLPVLAYALQLGAPKAQLHLWSFTRDAEQDEAQRAAIRRALSAALEQCGFEVHSAAHGLVCLGEKEEALLACDRCGYLDFVEHARFAAAEHETTAAQPLERVHTPACKTIETLACFLGISTAATAKALFFVAERERGDQLIFAVVRGDMMLSEAKLREAIGAYRLRPATEAEIRAIGAEPGYASPIGLVRDGRWMLVVDEVVARAPNLVAGANVAEYHLRNTNYGRDYTADCVADIAMPPLESACAQCNAPLRPVQGVALMREHRQGYEGTYLDPQGSERVPLLRHFAIDLEALLWALAAIHRDEFGLRLPSTVAPFHTHLVALGKDEAVVSTAEQLYALLARHGVEVLYDDRAESPGVKFNDADLMGVPLRLTVSTRALQAGSVEMRRRGSSKENATLVPLDAVLEHVRAALR
ncbi:MAG: His/Gly/Thr/Pro-type tRNA ligase C-terminal domain-containing protein [Thermoflexales bacterium]|nr:His/Gly/Thr/Pro-type tRNA ligase C-terminal domain-containing protein [Thermoflexales bacterium]MCS7325593.1 His/Gly/Thr/Pro-type tRNA ligase C-terminal domain-containing protein [Thermoflexales bacterium]MDW8053138.1 YbaK/EbsC family protein [Anaerolineae bacterium]MDW8291790.1 YbaK/EbsC family protein [Anaerolineae bacterium]